MNADSFRDPKPETDIGHQADRETLGRAHADQPVPWKTGDQLGDFRLEDLLGAGTSGHVYRAVDHSQLLPRLRALKLLLPGDPHNLLRNKLGFRGMMSITHPNLMAAHRIHQLDSFVGLSMELIEGVTFGQHVRHLKTFDRTQAYDQLLDLLRQSAAGLAHMHAHELIHRDVKPANIMVRHDGIIKLVDFGLVDRFRYQHVDGSSHSALVGTRRYLAPEVHWSQRYLPSGDVFSLGLVFLEALYEIARNKSVLSTPAAPGHPAQLDQADGIAEAIEDLPASVPQIIRETCRQMVSRQPADRPQAIELTRVGLSRSLPAALPATAPMIGREHELAVIIQWVNSVFSGSVGRFHIQGPSGIGKSRLIEAIIDYIEAKNWGQLFYAKCRTREDQPLQAFDQLCDAIANRYSRGDREPLELDPVSATILTSAFPVLSNVVKARVEIAPPGADTSSLDALEAAARMTEQLRLVGPLFLVIDDTQWADTDSRNVIDRLASAKGAEGLGIITVSRSSDAHRQPAQNTLALGPLADRHATNWLAGAAQRWGVDVPQQTLSELVAAAQGYPFRLSELAEEFRPDGLFNGKSGDTQPIIADSKAIDRMWQQRMGRLSDDAKRLIPFVATAGGDSPTSQLAELTGLDDAIDAAVSELARQRLIVDDATGGNCVRIVHDRVADRIVQSLPEPELRKAHLAWGTLLARQANPQCDAARIAGHFFAAEQPGQAVSHAILAAEDAESRLARYEAARLYQRVAQHVSPTEQVRHLRSAARCFRDAQYPAEAAICYQQLAELVPAHEKFEYQLTATVLLIRSGQHREAQGWIRALAKALRLPQPKPRWLAVPALLRRRGRLLWHGNHALVDRMNIQPPAETDPPLPPSVRNQLKMCFALVRPLSLYDNLYASELILLGSKLLLKYADTPLRVQAAVGEAVFACRDRGRRRRRGEAALERLRSISDSLPIPRVRGDVFAGIATSHALALRWNQVIEPVEQSDRDYRASDDAFGFEAAHTHWLAVWANWHLGRLTELRESTKAFNEAMRRSDRFHQLMASTGFAACAWLVNDRVSELLKIQSATIHDLKFATSPQLIDGSDWVGKMLLWLYTGSVGRARELHREMSPTLRKSPLSNMQLVRVVQNQLGILVALHELNVCFSETLVVRIKLLIHRLRIEQIDFATMLADLYEGLMTTLIAAGQSGSTAIRRAEWLLLRASNSAKRQHLLPFQLAADDALEHVRGENRTDQLICWMISQDVAKPLRLQRLYTIPLL